MTAWDLGNRIGHGDSTISTTGCLVCRREEKGEDVDKADIKHNESKGFQNVKTVPWSRPELMSLLVHIRSEKSGFKKKNCLRVKIDC